MADGLSNHPETVLLSERLDRVLGSTGTALREMRRDPDNRDKWSSGLAAIWLDKMGNNERAFMLATACKSAPEEVLTQALVDLGWTPPKKGE